MSDAGDSVTPAVARATTAGGLLRQARLAQGLHIAALAAAIKVVPRKLELLETDQFDQLPDATFTRALAQTVCRSLKIEAAPILALLPPPRGAGLEQVSQGLNMPFRERPGRLVPKEWTSLTSPVLWLVALIVLLTLAVYALPANWLRFSSAAIGRVSRAVPEPVKVETAPVTAVAAPLPASAAVAVATTTPSPASAASSADAAIAPLATEPDAVTASAASGVLQFRASSQSWVEVVDARGQSLISRLLQPGENVGVDGSLPMRVKIGNAAVTQVVFRGQPVELASRTRDNVARFELK
jgi:cytoskeleton protein RodZ